MAEQRSADDFEHGGHAQTPVSGLADPVIWSRRRFAGLIATSPFLLGAAARRPPLRIRAAQDIQILDPAFQTGGVEETINRAVQVTLTRYVPGTDRWAPYGAEIIDPIGDRAIAFRLRPELRWTGRFGPVTAEDVKFSFERIADPASNSPWHYVWKALDHVEVTGRRSGIIRLKSDYVPIWRAALPYWAGHIVCKRAVLAEGGRYTTQVPAMCGPYVIGDWQPKRRIRLSRNPGWRGPGPPVDDLDFVVVAETAAAELAFDAGELDITDVDKLSVRRYRHERRAGSRLIQPRGSSFTWLGLNIENPALRDIRVRRAIQYAVDVDAILFAAYGGSVERATGLIPSGVTGVRSRNLIGGRDVARARALLRAAGRPDGIKLSLSVINTSFWTIMAEIIQDNLRDVGIDLDIHTYDESIFWSLGVDSADARRRDLQLFLMTIPGGGDPSEFTVWFTSDQIGQYNWERIADPVIDGWNAAAQRVSDPRRRAIFYRAIQDRLEQSGAFLFIANNARSYLVGRDLDIGFGADDLVTPYFVRRTG